ncbi:MAG: hypothetical protein UR26_C0002G0187 [candidate division TM6 bacterium GW2011_GWF2_32_72]|nr:MAG: hypothetical protein UR26_C0002G0187 [candidate division TM6 bacterium GW2011_GWF2_32_72]
MKVRSNSLFLCLAIGLIALPACQGKKNTKTKKEKKVNLAYKEWSKMNFDELNQLKNEYVDSKRYDLAIKCLERLEKLEDISRENLQKVRLEMADICFENGQLPKSAEYYKKYADFYPGSKNSEYATYKAILCKFYSTLSADRDQKQTEEALELADKFLERSSIYKEHADEVRKIKQQCQNKLFERDENIFNFYLNRGSNKAAIVRLENIKKTFTNNNMNMEPKILALECQLAQKLNNTKLFEEKTKLLADKYPDHAIKIAQTAPKKKKYRHF